MVYSNAFDPTRPYDSDPAAQGDDEIRRIKAALVERFNTVFENFPDGDPLVLKASVLQGADHDTAVYLANNAAGTRATQVNNPSIILIMRVEGNTDASGAVVVDFNEAGFNAKYAMSKLVSVLAVSRAGAVTGTRIAVNVAANTLTLDTDYTAVTAVTWDLMLAFTA